MYISLLKILNIRVVSAFFSFSLIFLIAKFYSVDQVASYFVFVATARFLQSLNVFSLNISVMKSMSSVVDRCFVKELNVKFVGEAIVGFIIISVVVFLGVNLFRELSQLLGIVVFEHLLKAFYLSILISFNTICSGIYLGQKAYNRSVISLSLGASFFGIGLIFVDYYFFDQIIGPLNISIWASLLVSCINLFGVSKFLSSRVLKKILSPIRFFFVAQRSSQFTKLLSLSGSEVVSQLALVVIIYTLSSTGQDQDVASYGVIMRLAAVISMFSFSLNQYFSPEFSAGFSQMTHSVYKSYVTSIVGKVFPLYGALLLLSWLASFSLLAYLFESSISVEVAALILIMLTVQVVAGIYNLYRVALLMGDRMRLVASISIGINMLVICVSAYTLLFSPFLSPLTMGVLSYSFILVIQSFFYRFYFQRWSI